MLLALRQNQLCTRHLAQYQHDHYAKHGIPTVDVIVNPPIQFIDLCLMFLWVEIQIGLIFGQQVVERRIEDTNDLGTLVIHDCMLFLVPENRNSEPGFTSAPVDAIISLSLPLVVIRIGLEVQVSDVRRLVKRVYVCAGEIVYVCERPSIWTHPRRNNRHGYTIRASLLSPSTPNPQTYG